MSFRREPLVRRRKGSHINYRFDMAHNCSPEKEQGGRKLFGTLVECVKCFHAAELIC